MALSDLTPTISACVVSGCTSMAITDTTGVFSVTNTGGWDSGVTINVSSITSAIITITTPDGSEVTTDVTSQLPTSVLGEFSFNNIDLPEACDGEYTIEYSLSDNVNTKTISITIYSLCVVRRCVDKMWGNYALNEFTDSTCNCSQSSLSLKETAELGEALYNSIQNSAICNNAIRDSLLAKLQRLCAIQDCTCD